MTRVLVIVGEHHIDITGQLDQEQLLMLERCAQHERDVEYQREAVIQEWLNDPARYDNP